MEIGVPMSMPIGASNKKCIFNQNTFDDLIKTFSDCLTSLLKKTTKNPEGARKFDDYSLKFTIAYASLWFDSAIKQLNIGNSDIEQALIVTIKKAFIDRISQNLTINLRPDGGINVITFLYLRETEFREVIPLSAQDEFKWIGGLANHLQKFTNKQPIVELYGWKIKYADGYAIIPFEGYVYRIDKEPIKKEKVFPPG